MSQPAAKRHRSQSRDSITTRTSEGGTESAISRETKYSIYQDGRYPALLESQGSYMRESPSGLLPEELAYCDTLFTDPVTLPAEPLFEASRFRGFLGLLENKSELRICVDLHPRLVPSAELLSLSDHGKFGEIIEGYNDRWNKAILFYKKLPQPDRTVAFRESALTPEQRHRLGILPEVESYFSVREGMCFPFLTCEVKCGKQALDIADRPNANSMTIATRAMVELYRLTGRVGNAHRRAACFSISHDDKCVRIYAHYAEIDGGEPQYYRHLLRSFDCRDKNGHDRWTTWTFVINVISKFAPRRLSAIRCAIDEIPTSSAQSMDSTVTAGDAARDSSSQEIPCTPSTSQQDDVFIKPSSSRGRTTVKQQIQQLQDAGEARERRLMEQLELQYKGQIAQQEQRHKEQIAQQEQRYKEQIDLLKSLMPGRRP
ncbi:uncharacterized protein HMPREF1541_10442 [Cyphellophora europaea CBS 101466]|uniref:DUF7924 domain-containing protein n=1 Tax=Cyphellophora europaea (strain CBS 101466) TaxID=1220924 RepID=W2S7X2_CYPE1|nr:uncharacterized protein HMPREF1541_10442 [Cyphellophora europaea CBS 101466]ETN44772.1 hypothetical protein HMPREF1541_10442 [Cyphellophora europaea CBS 101466]